MKAKQGDIPGLVVRTLRVRVVGTSPLVLREFRDGDWVYGLGLKRAIVDAAAKHQEDVPLTKLRGAVHVVEQQIPLRFSERTTRQDERGKTKKRILERPEYADWEFDATLEYNAEALAPETLSQALIDAGEQIGIGQARLEFGGPCGAFRVDSL
jgi:hypothetical protein